MLSPFLRHLLPPITLAYTLQALVAAPSITAQSERVYDLSGSLTYLSCTALSLALPALRARHASALLATAGSRSGAAGGMGLAGKAWGLLLGGGFGKGASVGGGSVAAGMQWRQVVLSAAVGLWAVRLGSFLFARILKDGTDSRFTTIRTKPAIFLGAFAAQATWVTACLLPILALNALPRNLPIPRLLATDILGLGLFATGFALEIIADRQKDEWTADRRAKRHTQEFLTSGLWARSRHPNYFGEMMLWSGLATCAAGVLCGRVGQLGMGLGGGIGGVMGGRLVAAGMCAISPAFVTFLLLKVSGVPLSEDKYDKRFGHRKDYQEWKKNTPMLIPKLG